MDDPAEWTYKTWLAGCGTTVLLGIGIVVLLFIIWWYGGMNYAAPVGPVVCPPKFEASTIIIEQQRQTVICTYDDEVLINEQIHERRR